jgi:hypothetical protein
MRWCDHKKPVVGCESCIRKSRDFRWVCRCIVVKGRICGRLRDRLNEPCPKCAQRKAEQLAARKAGLALAAKQRAAAVKERRARQAAIARAALAIYKSYSAAAVAVGVSRSTVRRLVARG